MGGINPTTPTLRLDWVSDGTYPVASRFFVTASGHRVHFVEEGEGEPIVFVHGNRRAGAPVRHEIVEAVCTALEGALLRRRTRTGPLSAEETRDALARIEAAIAAGPDVLGRARERTGFEDAHVRAVGAPRRRRELRLGRSAPGPKRRPAPVALC